MADACDSTGLATQELTAEPSPATAAWDLLLQEPDLDPATIGDRLAVTRPSMSEEQMVKRLQGEVLATPAPPRSPAADPAASGGCGSSQRASGSSAGEDASSSLPATRRLFDPGVLAPLRNDPAAGLRACDVLPNAFEVCEVAGKGRGVIATKALKRGELLLLEQPLLRSHGRTHLFPEGSTFPDFEARLAMMLQLDLARWKKPWHHPHDTCTAQRKLAADIFWTNAVPVDFMDNPEMARALAVFPLVSRFNHSCAPNALFHWCPQRQRERVAVVRDIAVGEEVCVMYRPAFSTRAHRQASLLHGFGFECRCVACCVPCCRKSDANREAIQRLDDAIPRLCSQRRYRECVAMVEQMMRLSREERLDDPKFLGRCCDDAFQASVHAGSRAAASKWAALAADHWELVYGADDKDVLRAREDAKEAPSKQQLMARLARRDDFGLAASQVCAPQ